MVVITRPGIWADVADNGLFFIGHYVTTADPRIIGCVNLTTGLDLEPWPPAPSQPLYLRVAYNPITGLVEAVAQAASGSGLLWFSGTSWVSINSPCFGQNGCALGWNGLQMVIYTMLSASTYAREDLVLPVPIWPGGTGQTTQGWLQVFPGATAAEDNLRWTDPNRILHQAGLTLVLPSWAGDVVIGQGQTDIEGVNGASPFLAILGGGFEPHLVDDGQGGYAAAVRQLNGRCAFALFPPFPPLSAVPEPPIDPPVDPVDPPVDPPDVPVPPIDPPIPPQPPEEPPVPETLEETTARICYAFMDDTRMAEAQQTAKGVLEAADTALGHGHRPLVDYEIAVYADSRRYGNMWLVGEPFPTEQDPHWPSKYIDWLKARG